MFNSVAEYLNQLSNDQAFAELEKCCAAPKWVHAMMVARPFENDQSLFNIAADCWVALDRNERLLAFAAHARIGDVDSLRKKFAGTKQWAAGEQAGIDQASGDVLKALAKANNAYYEKFGYIFIICATGKSAEEMLETLNNRLPNDADTELKIASEEQIKITLLRLRKLNRS